MKIVNSSKLRQIKLFSLASYLLMSIASFTAIAEDFSQFPNWQAQQTNGNGLLSGDFQQSKTTPFLRRPLKSTGTISLNGDQGVLWHTKTPIESILILNQQAVTSIDSQGKVKQLTGASEINLVFANAMVGKWSTLTKHFKLKLINQQDLNQTCIAMTPIGISKKTIKHINVCGDKQQIKQIHFEQQSGAKTEINLDLKAVAKLSQQQLAYYQLVVKGK